VFCVSLANVFDNEVPTSWRADLFGLILATPNLDWLILTKRIGDAMAMMDAAGGWAGASPGDARNPLPHVWLGATIANQAEADRDIPKLMEVPAARDWLSCESLLGPIELNATPAGDILCRCAGCLAMTPDTLTAAATPPRQRSL